MTVEGFSPLYYIQNNKKKKGGVVVILKKGEIYYISNPASETFGTELQKDRPAVVVSVKEISGELESKGAIVAFLTTKPKVFSDFHIVTKSSGRTATLLLEQMSYRDVSRFGKKIGEVTESEMAEIDAALLRVHGIKTAEEQLREKNNIIAELRKAVEEKDIKLGTYQSMLTSLYAKAQ